MAVMAIFFSFRMLFLQTAMCLVQCSELVSIPKLTCARLQNEDIDLPVLEIPPVPDYTIPVGKIVLTGNMTFPQILQHSCERNNAVFVSDHVYITSELFETPVKPLTISTTQHPTLTSGLVTDVCITISFIVFVIDGKVLQYDRIADTFTSSAGISSPVTDIESMVCCELLTSWCRDMNRLVVAFNRISNDKIFYLSRDEGLTFVNMTFEEDFLGGIHAMTVLNTYSAVVAVIMKDEHHGLLASTHYSESVPVPVNLPFSVVADGDDALHLTQMQSGFSSLLIWDSKTIYYSSNSGQTVLPVYLHPTVNNNSSHLLNDGETIRQVITGIDGEFAVVTSNNRLYYGREGFYAEAVEFYNLDQPLTDNSVILFDEDHDITVFSHDFSRGSGNRPLRFRKRVIDIQKYLRDIQPLLATCPYQTLHTNWSGQTLYLDLNSKLELTTELTPQAWMDNQLIASSSNPSLLDSVSSYINVDIMNEGVLSKTMLTTLHQGNSEHALSGNEESVYTGVTNFRVCTTAQSLTCSKNSQVITPVSVGCPPYTHIRVKHEGGNCEEYKNMNYTIPKEYYDPTFRMGRYGDEGDSDLTVSYDFDTLGCPLRSYHNSKFKPILQLYHGDQYIEDIKCGFTLYEVHGMRSYTFSKLIEDTGCKHVPQTWVGMLLEQTSLNITNAWNKDNYLDCSKRWNSTKNYVPNAEDPYEVMTNVNDNYITWSDDNIIYVFEALLLDKDYSFCDLRVRFAVQVWGASPKGSIPTLMVCGVASAVGLLGVMLAYAGVMLAKKVQARKAKEMGILDKLDINKLGLTFMSRRERPSRLLSGSKFPGRRKFLQERFSSQEETCAVDAPGFLRIPQDKCPVPDSQKMTL